MTKNHSEQPKLSAPELQWIRQLRAHPELMERFAMIMEITAATNGPLKSADEVEGLLIRELRRLGNTSMGSWAAQAEQVLADRLKEQDGSARVLKKKLCRGGAFSER
jgi:2-iminoacetate synthase ThiH